MNNALLGPSFRLRSVMTKKDWVLLAVLAVVSACLWTWVWVEYQKPIVDPSWYSEHIVVQQQENEKNTAPSL